MAKEGTWYKGQVLSLVLGAADWYSYNVKYDGEDEICQ